MSEPLWQLPAALSHEEYEKVMAMIAAALSVEIEEAASKLRFFLESTDICTFSEETVRAMAAQRHDVILEDEAMALKVAKNKDFALIYNAINKVAGERQAETKAEREARERREQEERKGPIVLN